MQKINIQSMAFRRAPHGVLAKALETGPFARVKVPLLGNVRAALTHDAVQAVLKDTNRFAVNARNAGHKRAFGLAFMPKSFRLLVDNILALDDPDHRRLRRLADAPFRRAAIDTQRQQISAQIDTFLEVAERSAAQQGHIDLAKLVFQPLPLLIISDMLGLRPEARERLMRSMDGLSAASSTWGILLALGGMGKMTLQLREEIDAARRDPQPGLLAKLVNAEHEGGKMSEEELISLVLILFVAGHDTTINLLTSGLYTLLTYPGAWETVRELTQEEWRIAVDELMRYAMPVHIAKPRFVIKDTEIAGEKFRRGDKVMTLLGAANLDPAVFDRPLELDLARRPNRHTGWGSGPHICLGLHLARMQAELCFAKIAQRWPGLRLIEDGVIWSKRLGTRGLNKMPVSLD